MSSPPDAATIVAAIKEAEQLARAGELDRAAQRLTEVATHVPEQLDALTGLAYLAMRRDEPTAAAAWFDRALNAGPGQSTVATVPPSQARIEWLRDAAMMHQRAGNALRGRECLAELATRVPSPDNLLALAMAHNALREYDAALPILQRAIRVQPMAWELHYNLGRLLGASGRYDDEIAAYRHALKLAPNAVPAHVNLGVALRDLHRFDDAMQSFKRAAQIDPSSASARTNRAQTNLMRGDFAHGWREYEWRWRDGPPSRPSFADDRNQWDGKAALAGKTILLFAEQGLGDTIQFSRLALTLAERQPGARIILRVQAALAALFQASPRFVAAGVDVVSEGEGLPPFDVQAALMSLPHLLNLRVDNVPAPIPYLEGPDGAASASASTDARTARRRVGLVWRGNPDHVNDHNRSIGLAACEALLRATQEHVEWVALHDRLPEDEGALLAQLDAQGVIRDLRPHLKTFGNTAAQVATLEQVISVDSAVAHLTGAMGQPVWVLLPFTPDFRWLLQRQDTPWYPQARLFRQGQRGDWAGVLEAVEAALG